MKHEDHFKVLAQDTVNLSQFNLDLLDDRVVAIYAALAADPILGPYVKGKIPQGSWATPRSSSRRRDTSSTPTSSSCWRRTPTGP